MFEGFEQRQITTSGTTINLVKGGSGPGLLLLHGYPQTHAMWHKIAPRLAQDFTVVAADLRGYGDSGKPHGDPEHLTYAKRAMAQDQVEVMQQLGFETFNVVGHDRGARRIASPWTTHSACRGSLCWTSFRLTRCSASSIRRWRHRRITGFSSSNLTTCPNDSLGQFLNAFYKIPLDVPRSACP